MANKRPERDAAYYRDQYRRYEGTPKGKKDRAQRNAARAKAIDIGLARKGDGKDIDHIRPIKRGGGNAIANLRSRSRSVNRASKGPPQR